MTKEEFYKRIENYGINLHLYQVAFGYETDKMYYAGIYNDDDKWIVYQVGDRNKVVILYEGNEEEAYAYIYDILFVDIRNAGFINQSITKKVIQTSRSYVCNFLQKKYNISQNDAEDAWEYLLYDFHVLNEVKYFALNGKFVPSNDCYRVEGYSAQDIYEKTYLTEIGAYNYLIYLDKHPEQALKDLKNGLSRKCKRK